ncbi:adenylate/guanylate cyclase domain-containing protein [Dongia deserti]|uniref:adenylate/guanylate cyclase domain-containing protein n=1 Tax=Dongia deserti TaxID=2268030 RepID=UPI002549A2E4|nr:adenylate/guanylate cyclase domain-containing protein [Dongia deserti]
MGYAEILIEDAPRCGLEHCAADLRKMCQAGLDLQRLVHDLLDPDALGKRAGGSDYDEFKSKLRHDLRTPLTALKGYGEMLLEDALEAPAAAFADDLQKLLNAAKRLLTRLDGLVEFASGESKEVSIAESETSLFPALGRIVRPRSGELIADKPDAYRILVVDDHESNRDLLSRRLTRDAHHVVTAATGESALALIEQEPFDLILLDLLMPGMSGYEVLERLKCDPRHNEIPVLMISALKEIESAVRCIEAGAEDYLAKPFDPVLLRARVNACLEKKRLRDREKIMLQQLRFERDRSDALLLSILPAPIVARLNLGESVIADHVADATILFADLVGFTNLSARLSATSLVHLLNVLFSDFDRLSVQFGLEKIKTIGDAYMLAGGLLAPCSDHAEAVADMALAMRDTLQAASQRIGEPLQLRIGIHTGSVVSGIIGTHKFIFDVWGDTVNTASRMESHGTPNEISVSAATYARLREKFTFEACGTLDLKGKGPVEAYFLRGRRDSHGRPLDFWYGGSRMP